MGQWEYTKVKIKKNIYIM